MADQKRGSRISIDFSREVADAPEAPPAAEPGRSLRDIQRDPNGPLAGARRASELREVAPLAAARERQEARRRLAAEVDAAPLNGGGEPELG